MLTHTEALETILENVQVMGMETKTPAKAKGQILAEDIYSDYTLPMRETARPDGYAVKAEDIVKASRDNPVTLEIVETVRAGYLPVKAVLPGTAIRIMTGSVIPEGTGCIVRFEDTDEPENKNGPNPANPTHVKIYVSQAPGVNVNKTGGNTKEGALLISKSTLIGPAQLAVLTATGRKTVLVFRRPKIAIITTGDELVKSSAPLTPGKAYNSNEIAIQSLVTHYGGTPWIISAARDDEKSLISRMQGGLAADAIITTGGVSRGDYDLVRKVIGKLGKLVFFRINMAPGAACAFGLLYKSAPKDGPSTIPVFALSGPPQGCIINFETLVRLALFKMRGLQELSHPTVEAVSQVSFTNSGPMNMVRWTVLKRLNGGYTVTQNNADAVYAQIAAANSLTIVPSGVTINAGEKIPVLPLDWCG